MDVKSDNLVRRLPSSSLTSAIIRAAMKVHTALGPGLLESAYESCLAHELRKANLRVQTQVILPISYDGVELDAGYRIDMVVEDAVLLELKAIDSIAPIHKAQLLSYLKLSNKRLGLLIDFHVSHLREGIVRIAN